MIHLQTSQLEASNQEISIQDFSQGSKGERWGELALSSIVQRTTKETHTSHILCRERNLHYCAWELGCWLASSTSLDAESMMKPACKLRGRFHMQKSQFGP